MTNVIERRRFSELGDQQLLEQTRRLAANQRCLEVHILDHLDEIDRRGLALRRGFSSLFDYAVRELRLTDAAAQRRIQAMRLCRRHGWVRASLQSGELSMTSAAQLETTFAGAERVERQWRTGRRNVGQGRCHDQDHDCAGRTRQLGLPAAPGEAGEQRERGPRSAPGLAPRAEQCAGDAAAVNTPVVPVTSQVVAQDRGAGHAGTLLPRPELNGNAALFPAPSCASAPVPVPVAGPAAPSSDDGPAPQLLPPTDLPASASASAPVAEPEPVVAPSESRHTASRAPEPLWDDPFAELSPSPVSTAPLLHPQRQRELIEQAVGMSTRQVASLLAAAAPEVVPPRDTLRAVAPDRYTLKVTIDQECEQGLRLLKDLMSHVDPRMSWGDLVARLVREGVARHDPRGGGSGQRRRRSAGSAGSADASPRRAPNKTCAAGAAAGPAQRVHESSGRAPNRTRATGAPAAPARRGGGATPAPPGDTAATERQNPVAMLASAAPPSQSGPAALLDGARVGGAPSGAHAAAAHAATSAPKFASGALADGCHAGGAVPGSPVATSAPEPALGVSLDGGPSGASAGAASHTACDSVRSRHQSPPRRHIPAAVRRHIWQRDGGRCCYRDPLTGRRCTSSHLLQIDHLLPVAEGGGRSRPTWFSAALLITACATATDRRLRRSPRCSASSALLPRRSTALADGSQVARRDTLRSSARRACIFATASGGAGAHRRWRCSWPPSPTADPPHRASASPDGRFDGPGSRAGRGGYRRGARTATTRAVGDGPRFSYAEGAMNTHLLSDAAIRKFIVDGYVQVQTDLPESVHRAIFEKSDAIFSKIRSPDVEWAYNPLNNVLPVVPELQQIMDAPQVRGALTSLLGRNYVMLPHRHCHPNFAKPAVSAADGRKLIMGIHKDGHAGGQKPRHRVPRWAILFYYPQECPDEQGPTVIVPRSHYQHNLARQGDSDPNLTLTPRADGTYGLPEHYIHRTMLPLACGLGAVSIMHFDVGHSVIENLAEQHRYGQKFVFMRTEEPHTPTWDNQSEGWEQPDVTAIPDHEILWTYLWNWMRGAADRFRRGAGVPLQRRSAVELIRLLEAPEVAQRLQAANELGFLRAAAADTEGTVAPLVRALRDEFEPVRLNAAYALGAIGTPALAPLLELLATDAAFYDFDPVTHVSIAAHSLGAVGGAAVEALAERLTADGEHTRSGVAYALGEIGRPAAGALPRLLEAARDASPNVRRHALSAIGIVATPGDGIEEALLGRLASEPDSELRQYVLQALFRIGPTSAAGVPALAAALGDDDGYVGAYAAEQLFRTGTPEAFAALVPYLRGQRWFPHEPLSEQRIVERRERQRTARLAKRRRAPELSVTVGAG